MNSYMLKNVMYVPAMANPVQGKLKFDISSAIVIHEAR
jgi:hypothetical protein